MQVEPISITMDLELAELVRDAAVRSGMSVSGWINSVVSERLRNEALGSALDVWESEDGPITEAEFASVERVLRCR